MSIATAITNAQQKVANAYTAVSNKGGTLPVTQDLSNLPTAISSISSSKYGATLDSFLGDVDNDGFLQAPTEQTNLVFTGVQNIWVDGLRYRFAYNPVIKSASFPDLTILTKDRGLYCAFQGSSIESVSFPALSLCQTGGSMLKSTFQDCTSLTSVSFPVLAKFNAGSGAYSMLQGCTALTSINFPALTSLYSAYGFYSMCRECTTLTSVGFPVLETIRGNQALTYAFRGCTSLTTLSFPALKNLGDTTTQFNNMLTDVTGCTVHFPSNLQSTIGSWSSVTAGFGGTNTTVLFDLPSTAS